MTEELKLNPKLKFIGNMLALVRAGLITLMVWASALSIFKFIYISLAIYIPGSDNENTIKGIFIAIVFVSIFLFSASTNKSHAAAKRENIKKLLIVTLGIVCAVLTGVMQMYVDSL